MKRYILFRFDQYDACGGMDDLLGYADSIAEAFQMAIDTFTGEWHYDFIQIFDSVTTTIVELN